MSIVVCLSVLYFASALAYWADPRPLPVPVEGVSAGNLRSTYGAPRSGGKRRHEGVDIFARRGTPVRSPGFGIVVYRGNMPLGGRVVYTFGHRGMLCYYAHLDRWAEELHIGQIVRPGTLLGTVGNTGNARTTRPHLHFETRPLPIALRSVDPVSLLQDG